MDPAKHNHWTFGPTFLHQPPAKWPANPVVSPTPTQTEEICNTAFCCNIVMTSPTAPDLIQFKSWYELVHVTYLSLHGTTAPPMMASDWLETEVIILKRAQQESFPIVLVLDHRITMLQVQDY